VLTVHSKKHRSTSIKKLALKTSVKKKRICLV